MSFEQILNNNDDYDDDLSPGGSLSQRCFSGWSLKKKKKTKHCPMGWEWKYDFLNLVCMYLSLVTLIFFQESQAYSAGKQQERAMQTKAL